MLQLAIPEQEFYDDEKEMFFRLKPQRLQLEHSLLSLSRWESKWKKSFIDQDNLTPEEFLDYVRCMSINRNVEEYVFSSLTAENLKTIKAYIKDSMTATTFRSFQSTQQKRKKRIVTSERIYFWMVTYQIPFECEKWHLNRLLTLIRICQIENNPGKKMSKKEILAQNHALNEERRRMYGTRG